MENKNNLLVKMENAGVYLNNKWLVKDVTLNIEKGKIITLIGPNGSGKTTTAKIALGLYKNISGKVEKYTKKIAYVPQKISIDWTLPIRVFDFMNLTSDLQNNETNEALEKLERLSEFSIHSIEQPIKKNHWQEMAKLCQLSPIPIALDEELIGRNFNLSLIHI